ncbi:TRAP transporter substrate-binding protein DctP [Bacillus sp. B15-48]|uniref:TRAP transporter substrate-binding protein DctP n=1 Tax=Bacillus sp. B15-48 TaxID=1548601 RepID=UPI00193FE19D|nr:TRAP transporter substrate-binding protein DctP [Bacillus sp. B15-48]MBM4763322.1 hypothetical protein [Bacillus sp. B15-48]
MMKKKAIIFSWLFVLFLIMTACSSGSTSGTEGAGEEETRGNDSQEEITLKVATVTPEQDDDSVYVYKAWMDRVTELTDGQIQFEWYPAGQLGSLSDYITLVNNKAIDIGMFTFSAFPNEMPVAHNLFGLPGVFNSALEGSTVAWNLIQDDFLLQSDFLSNGVRPLVVTTTPPYDILSKEEIRVPADLKGVKLKTGSGMQTNLAEFIGATGVPLALPDVYEAYERGTVDAQLAYASTDTSYGYREISNYGTLNIGASAGSTGLLIGEPLFQSLPVNVQEAMMQAGEEVSSSGGKAFDEETAAREQRWIADGDVNLFEPTPEEMAEWEKVFEEFNQYWLEQKNDEQLNQAYDMLLEEVEKFRANN